MRLARTFGTCVWHVGFRQVRFGHVRFGHIPIYGDMLNGLAHASLTHEHSLGTSRPINAIALKLPFLFFSLAKHLTYDEEYLTLVQ